MSYVLELSPWRLIRVGGLGPSHSCGKRGDPEDAIDRTSTPQSSTGCVVLRVLSSQGKEPEGLAWGAPA